MVSEHDLGTLCGLIFISKIIKGPPLDIETKISFVEEETMTRDEKGISYDGEEHIKIMEPIIEEMNKNIMKGFKLLAIQFWRKYIDFKKTKEKMHHLA